MARERVVIHVVVVVIPSLELLILLVLLLLELTLQHKNLLLQGIGIVGLRSSRVAHIADVAHSSHIRVIVAIAIAIRIEALLLVRSLRAASLAKEGIVVLLLELLRIHSVVAVIVVVIHASNATHIVRAVGHIHGILLPPLLLLISAKLIAPVGVLGSHVSKGPHTSATVPGEVRIVGTPQLIAALDSSELLCLLLLHHGMELLPLLLLVLKRHVVHVLKVPSLRILLELELLLLLLKVGLLQLLLLLEVVHSVVSAGVVSHVVHHQILALGSLLLLLESPSLVTIPVLV